MRQPLHRRKHFTTQSLAVRAKPHKFPLIGAHQPHAAYVDRFNYGNRDISGGIDQFWLTGWLRISANEQVKFLRRFYVNQFGLSERTVQMTKDILVLEETPDYRLSGKTGWAGHGEPGAQQTGWLVGYLEREGKVFYFALNVDVKKKQDAAARMKIVRAVFGDLGLMDAARHMPMAAWEARRHRSCANLYSFDGHYNPPTVV